MMEEDAVTDREGFKGLQGRIAIASARLSRMTERACGALVGLMVLVVWMGVMSRYVVDLGATWTEEFSRYVMIWAALLAVPVGVHHREHIGFEMVFAMLPEAARRPLRVVLDLVGFGFFSFLAYFGVGMTAVGASQYATIFGMTMMVPFAAVPVSAALAALQTLAVLVRDINDGTGELPGAFDDLEGAA